MKSIVIFFAIVFVALAAVFFGVYGVRRGFRTPDAPANFAKHMITWSNRQPGTREAFGSTWTNMQNDMNNVAYSRGVPKVDGNTVQFTDWDTNALRVITGWSIEVTRERP